LSGADAVGYSTYLSLGTSDIYDENGTSMITNQGTLPTSSATEFLTYPIPNENCHGTVYAFISWTTDNNNDGGSGMAIYDFQRTAGSNATAVSGINGTIQGTTFTVDTDVNTSGGTSSVQNIKFRLTANTGAGSGKFRVVMYFHRTTASST